MVGRCGELATQLLQFLVARRGKGHIQCAALQTRWNRHADGRGQLQLSNPPANPIFRLTEPREAPTPQLLFDLFQFISPAQTGIGCDVRERFLFEDLMDFGVVAKRDLLEPVHKITEMILANL